MIPSSTKFSNSWIWRAGSTVLTLSIWSVLWSAWLYSSYIIYRNCPMKCLALQFVHYRSVLWRAGSTVLTLSIMKCPMKCLVLQFLHYMKCLALQFLHYLWELSYEVSTVRTYLCEVLWRAGSTVLTLSIWSDLERQLVHKSWCDQFSPGSLES